MFIAALFTIAKIRKLPKYPSADKWIKKAAIHLHSGILLGHKEEENFTLFDSMGGPGEHCAK